MSKPYRVTTYIDGLNLYHALCERCPKHHRWLDLWALSEKLIRGSETLTCVKYFSAYATWLPKPYATHREYVAALESRGVTAILGKFKEKDRSCRSCGSVWKGHEEKESDVNIAIHLLKDAMEDRFDRAILITADSDLCPAINMVRALQKRLQVFVATPPGMYGRARDLNPGMEITKGRLAASLFPEIVLDSEGREVARRPSNYAPPQA